MSKLLSLGAGIFTLCVASLAWGAPPADYFTFIINNKSSFFLTLGGHGVYNGGYWCDLENRLQLSNVLVPGLNKASLCRQGSEYTNYAGFMTYQAKLDNNNSVGCVFKTQANVASDGTQTLVPTVGNVSKGSQYTASCNVVNVDNSQRTVTMDIDIVALGHKK